MPLSLSEAIDHLCDAINIPQLVKTDNVTYKHVTGLRKESQKILTGDVDTALDGISLATGVGVPVPFPDWFCLDISLRWGRSWLC